MKKKEDDINVTEENVNLELVKENIKDMGGIINILEEEVLKDETEFDKSRLAFYIGRLETIFLHTGSLAGWFKK